MKGFGFGGLALLAALYLRWIIDAQYSNFQPSQQLLEDNLPFLTPFLLHFMRNWLPMKYRTGSTIAVVSLVLIYIVFSQGRAALLGLLVALLAHTTLVLHWRLRMGVAAALLLLAVSASFDSQRFIRGADLSGSFTELVDQFTNQRTQIWRHALSAHPRNVMVGVGIGNVNREQLVLSLKVGRENKVVMVKHLHNFLFDAWYETGIIGLLALLIWLATAFKRGFDTWRLKKQPYCAQAGVFLAASSAIITSAFQLLLHFEAICCMPLSLKSLRRPFTSKTLGLSCPAPYTGLRQAVHLIC